MFLIMLLLRRGARYALMTTVIGLATTLPGVCLAVDMHGLQLVDTPQEEADVPDVPDAMVSQFQQAAELAESNVEDFAYPHLDFANGRVSIRAATARGQQLGAQLAQKIAGPGMDGRPTIPPEVATSSRSIQLLESITDQLISWTANSANDGQLIRSIGQDTDQNRLVLTVASPSDRLFAAIASAFGTSAIAVRVDAKTWSADVGIRKLDRSPFWGGADIDARNQRDEVQFYCSTGFPWRLSMTLAGTHVTHGMLTAGHCTLNPAPTYYHSTLGVYEGRVLPGWSTFQRGVGTVKMTGQSTYMGDAALMLVTPVDTNIQNRVYSGPTDSGVSHKVTAISRGEMYLHQKGVCTSGVTTGEQCGYTVISVHNTVNADEGVTRNVAILQKKTGCSRPGDSGGPVYTVVDGNAIAQGILDGHESGIGSPTNCHTYVTDIHTFIRAFPGTIAVD